MVKIGILNLHHGYDETSWFVDTFVYGKVRENIIEHYDEININSFEDLMNTLYNYLQPSETTVLNVTDLAYNNTHVIQSIYNICQDVNQPNFNKLASQITKNILVQGTMILIKRDIQDDKVKYIDFNINDLIELVQNTFVHYSLLIKPNAIENNIINNDAIINFPYINDVLESKIEEYTFKYIRYNEHKFIDYTFTFYSDISASREDSNLNILASTIYGKKIYGEVYITLTTTREDFLQNLNLTKELLTKIYYIYATNSEDIDFKKYSVKPQQTTENLNDNGFPAITYYPNFFYVIYREYELIKNKKITANPYKFTHVLNDIV